ncbi:carboxypeptidase-like regulatory domain-containing protein [Constantimarinum furrinae]|uniref:Uncharacterized protein n=1 Tax=Constantimarinum furrinae TaxID=2562285 RepID=A0A7G8PRA4_9FLAO|nr:carboxypeptidase-like regulatory domain-containing protein [Constantimarinum furrinae]QNJ96870.1 hypothetical protein ALE3EI_0282 [Constantimarinum furrinae]
MKLTLLVFFFFITTLLAIGQDIDRVQIDGKITAPLGDDTEGVTVYNVSSQQGTVTDKEGKFTLSVAENDRIYITALQFQSFTVIVDSGVIEYKRMNIYLNPAVNQLEEVIVRPYDLTGNIIADLKRIKTANTTVNWDLSYEALEFGYEFSADENTKVDGNAAQDALGTGGIKNGFNFVGIFNLLFPKKKKTNHEVSVTKEVITNALRQRYSNQFIAEKFGIPTEKVNEFIYFTEDNGLPADLLKAENELELLNFLHQQSNDYKTQIGIN